MLIPTACPASASTPPPRPFPPSARSTHLASGARRLCCPKPRPPPRQLQLATTHPCLTHPITTLCTAISASCLSSPVCLARDAILQSVLEPSLQAHHAHAHRHVRAHQHTRKERQEPTVKRSTTYTNRNTKLQCRQPLQISILIFRKLYTPRRSLPAGACTHTPCAPSSRDRATCGCQTCGRPS